MTSRIRSLATLLAWALFSGAGSLSAAPGDLAVYFGSFDPFHKGHMAVVDGVAAEMDLPEVLLVPYPEGYQKSHGANYRQRLGMARAMVFRHKKVGLVPPALVAQAWREGGARGWRAAVYRTLYKQLPPHGLVLDIVGMDEFHRHLRDGTFPGVDEPRMLMVVDRPGYTLDVDLIRTSGVAPGKFLFLHPDTHEIDSADLRARVARGEDVAADVPRLISRLISSGKLYRR